LYNGSTNGMPGATGGVNGPAWSYMGAFFQGGSNNTAMYGGQTSGFNDTNRDYNQGGNDPFQLHPAPNGPMPPNGNGCVATTTQTGHFSGMVVTLGDGSVRVVNVGVSQRTWQEANYPFDGVVLPADWNN
jgi:hypothetical protein